MYGDQNGWLYLVVNPDIEKTGFDILELFFIMMYLNYLSHLYNVKELCSFSLKSSLSVYDFLKKL